MTNAHKVPDISNIKIYPIQSKECSKKFYCGSSIIDKWIKEKAFKLHEKFRLKVFCASFLGNSDIIGFYSLSFSAEETKFLFNQDGDYYKNGHAPFIYISWLAVHQKLQSNGIGTILLMDALRRAYQVSTHVPFYGVALRSLNERTQRKYERHGFVVRESSTNPLMILPVWHLIDLMGNP